MTFVESSLPEFDQEMQGGEELFIMPRMALVKNLFINHIVHHRAFLVSYLRMNDIECPLLYG